MKRRGFLGATAGFAIYGVREAFSQDDKAGADKAARDERLDPLFLRRALADMKSSGRAGVVLVVPDDESARRELGQFLFAMVDQEPCWTELRGVANSQQGYASWVAMAQDLNAASLVICLPESLAEKLYRVKKRETLVLLDPTGQELARTNLQMSARTHLDVLQSLLLFVKGARSARLTRVAKIARCGLSAQQREQLDTSMAVLLDSEASASKIDEVMQGIRVLRRKCGAVLVSAAERESNPVVREHLRRVFRIKSKVDRRLPYGTTMPRWVDEGCAHYREARPGEKIEPVAIECGMAMPTRQGRRYVRFVSRKSERRERR